MDSSTKESAVMWVLVVAVVAAFAVSTSNGQQPDCTSQLAPAVPCLGFVQGTDQKPPKDCCSGLANLTKTSPVCLCSLANGGISLPGITVNVTRGLQLPTLCKLKGADPSRCAALLGPSPAPSTGGGVAAAGPAPAMESGGNEPSGGSANAKSPTGSTSAAIFSAASPIWMCFAAALSASAALRHFL